MGGRLAPHTLNPHKKRASRNPTCKTESAIIMIMEYEETLTIRLSKKQLMMLELWAKQHKVSISYSIRFAINQMMGVNDES